MAEAHINKSIRRQQQTIHDYDPLLIRPVKSVDIIPTIEQFSNDERKTLLKNLVSVELTTGCTSGCSDCYLMIPHGVTSQISYSSLDEFFNRYHTELPEYIDFYYGSEPFDWREGERGLSDIYKIYKKYRPQVEVKFTTYFPKGSEEQMSLVAAEMIKNTPKDEEANEYIRISLRQKQPAQRHKELLDLKKRISVVKKMVSDILGPNYLQQIEEFFYEKNVLSGILIVPESAQRIKQGRDYQELERSKLDRMQLELSISCADGVVLSSEGFRGVMMDSLSIQNPRGETHWEIKPGDEFRAPLRRYKIDSTEYEMFLFEYRQSGTITPQPLIMPNLTTFVNKSGKIEEQEEFSMSREVRSYHHLLHSLSQDLAMSWVDDENKGAIEFLFDRLEIEYKSRRKRLARELQRPTENLEQNYFYETGRLYLILMDFLFSFIRKRVNTGMFKQKNIISSFSWANQLTSMDIERLDLEENLNMFLEMQH